MEFVKSENRVGEFLEKVKDNGDEGNFIQNSAR